MMRILFILIILGLGACSQQKESSGIKPFDLLGSVPPNSPYLFFAAEPLPDFIQQLMDQHGDGLWQALWLNKKRAAIGLDASGQWVLYGLGLYPVLKVPVSDANKLRAYWQQQLKNQGLSSEKLDRYERVILNPQLHLIFTIRDQQAALALLPPNHPLESIWQPGQMPNLDWVKQRGFLPYGLGYIDFRSLWPPLLSPCPQLAQSLAAAMPQAYLGYTDLQPDHYQTQAYFSLSSTMQDWLGRMIQPAFQLDEQAWLSLSLGLDLAQAKLAVQALFNYLSQQDCSLYPAADLKRLASLIDLLAQPNLLSIRGLNISLKKPIDFAQQRAEGYVLLRSKEPDQVFNLLSLWDFAFAQVQLPASGQAVQVPLKRGPIWAAKQQDVLILLSQKNIKPQIKTGIPALFSLHYRPLKFFDRLKIKINLERGQLKWTTELRPSFVESLP